MTISSSGQAFWNQRHVLAAMAPRLRQLIDAVGRPTDLYLFQWAQLIAFTVDFQPDLIVELGRGYGNSTCCFLESAQQLEKNGGSCRLVSLCLDGTWANRTVKQLGNLCDRSWHARGEVLQGDILDYDFGTAFAGAKRVLIFWDAHGTAVAEHVLSRMLPQIAPRPHVVVMHDICDVQYDGFVTPSYGDAHLWDGECATTNYFRIGNIMSSVTQAILALDFTGRNRIELHSAGEGLHREVRSNETRRAEVVRLLGDDMTQMIAGWYWFSLNEATGAVTFPRPRIRVDPPKEAEPRPRSLPSRLVGAGRNIAHVIKRKLLRA